MPALFLSRADRRSAKRGWGDDWQEEEEEEEEGVGEGSEDSFAGEGVSSGNAAAANANRGTVKKGARSPLKVTTNQPNLISGLW